MNTAIRIGALSFIMSVYMCWAFRGVEYDPIEMMPAILGFFVAFTICTIIATVLYKMMKQPGEDALSAFAFRVWVVTASLATVGWLVFYGQDAAAAGEFRDNVIVGGVIMAVMVGILNYVFAYAIDYGSEYFKLKRRRT